MRPIRPAIAVLALLLAAPVAAQDTLTVVAGPHYEAGPLKRVLMGEGYREAWTAPVRVPVLDPDAYAGGLTIIQRGGGLATDALRMQGADGRQYLFRTVDKNPERGLPEDLHGTLVADAVQDAVAAKHPAAGVVVAPLAGALGLLHATPELYRMPDHPFLGEHRAEFAGRLGQVEERPEEAGDEGGPGFAGAERVSGSEAMLERLEDDPAERVDAREYLAARLLDVVVGDWDRHMDQWRWARIEGDGGALWRPVPRDRDNAFSRHEGLVLSAARAVQPQLTRYGATIDQVHGLVVHASNLDRRLLSGLEWPAWERAVADFQARVTDAAIDEAVSRLPPAYRALHGEFFATTLRARRDSLGPAARAYYRMLATDVDVRGSDEDEVAEVDRHADGSVEVQVRAGEGAAPGFRRRFHPAETREVRLYLQGGDDRALVRGTAPGGIRVRIVGGGGDDVLVDSSRGGGRTVFHDHRGTNTFEPGTGARVDTRGWEEPGRDTLFGNPPAPRDWGGSASLLSPALGWPRGVGPVVGAGPVWTRYGFRQRPYARRTAVQLLWSPLRGGFALEAGHDRVRTGSRGGTRLHARASSYDYTRFHGYGNATPGTGERRWEVESNRVGAGARLYGLLGSRTRWEAGPELRWTDPGPVAAAEAGPPPNGSRSFGQAGVEASATWDARDDAAQPRRGAWARLGGRGYAAEFGTFGGAEAEARGYLSAGAGTTLALRAGGSAALGDFPLQEAAFVGGLGTLRGYAEQRFAGDRALYGGAELRQRVGPVNLRVVRGRLGVMALADAGRVYVDGRSPGGWHTGAGGGLWFEALGRVATAALVRGDAWRLHLSFGPQF